VGARALRQNMTSLGPLVLPLSEQLLFAANFTSRQLCRRSKALAQLLPVPWTRPYTPNFKKAFDFYCIHTGGRGIIDGLEKEMSLSRQQVEPSRASLYRFGNTSSTRYGGAGQHTCQCKQLPVPVVVCCLQCESPSI